MLQRLSLFLFISLLLTGCGGSSKAIRWEPYQTQADQWVGILGLQVVPVMESKDPSNCGFFAKGRRIVYLRVDAQCPDWKGGLIHELTHYEVIYKHLADNEDYHGPFFQNRLKENRRKVGL